MNVQFIHDFNSNTEEEFSKIQNDLVKDIILKSKLYNNDIKTCAGVDLAYWMKDEEEYATCCIVVIDYKTKEVLKKVDSYGKINQSYIASSLASKF